MRLISWRLSVPLLLVIAMVAVACSSSDEGTATPASTTPAASATGAVATPAATQDQDQTLRVNLGGEPQSLDPQRATDVTSITVLRSIYATLLTVDENQAIQPDLAAEVPTIENGGISADGLVYTFKLRPDLKWDDGTPLVAQNFVDGAKRLFEPGSGNYYVDFYRVLAAAGKNDEVVKALGEGKEGAEVEALEAEVAANLEVEAPDATTVVYHLSRQSPVFLLLATMWPLYPVRQDIVDAHGDTWTEAGTLVSNGPFMLKEWKHTESITLEKNPNYYGAADVVLQTITMDMIADKAVEFLAYQNGELDAIWLGPEQLVQVRANTALQKEFSAYALLSTSGVYFNIADEALSDVKVRQALTGAFNREEYAETVREGAVLPAYGWVPPGMPGHDPEVGLQYKDTVDKAKQLLADAGYPGGAGLSLEILSADSSVAQLTAEWAKEQWEKNLGVTVTINTLERATYFAERNAGKYQVTAGGWGADYPDPQNWMPLFRTGGGLNSGSFSNADFDKLIDAADIELNNERRIDLYRQAQVIMIEEAPFAPLYYGRRNVLVKPWVQGLTTSSMESDIPGDLFFDRLKIVGRTN
ncbi:MAG: ABC transporter substrate-binding protein [Dehalococcoidia bacterium]